MRQAARQSKVKNTVIFLLLYTELCDQVIPSEVLLDDQQRAAQTPVSYAAACHLFHLLECGENTYFFNPCAPLQFKIQSRTN